MTYLSDPCKRQERQNFKKFAALIAAPANLSTGFKMPADGEVYVSSSNVQAAAAGVVTASDPVATRTLGVPASAAGTQQHVGKLSRATSVVKAATAGIGTVSVYVRDGIGRRFLIAQG